MICLLVLFSLLVIKVDSGAVGECRSECVEQNLYKIVRVHLKDDFVMAGICKNTTVSTGSLSTVIPFICNRHHGIWTLDTEDEEGIVQFQIRCPPNDPVPPIQLATCPRSF
ncbi:unnamed protein product [Haemonchus placei]|uniref:SUEL-type lectin domain-containing protein n=1 Tax=Haemonchus placei TaxID=6290 RepID=A0A158QMZ3_HAEPC|nr:unnamed protein product [Haemonchus placei]